MCPYSIEAAGQGKQAVHFCPAQYPGPHGLLLGLPQVVISVSIALIGVAVQAQWLLTLASIGRVQRCIARVDGRLDLTVALA